MNVILTSIGRRNYLVDYFRQALAGSGEVWASDRSPYAPALYSADRTAMLPPVGSDEYSAALLDLCRRETIGLVVPLIDPELEILAPMYDQFLDAGVRLLVSPPETIDIGFDKVRTAEFARQHGLAAPESVLSVDEALKALRDGRMAWPLMVKPRRGSASSGLHVCRTQDELRVAFRGGQRDMIQQFIEADEYGYDLLSDFECRPVSVFCKKKLAMRAGETDKAVSTDREDLIAFGLRIAEALDLRGPLDADVFLTDDGPQLLELNPRFGGGYPCSHGAGADFPGKLLRMLRGERVASDVGSCPAGVHMFKQYDIVIRSAEDVDAVASPPADAPSPRRRA